MRKSHLAFLAAALVGVAMIIIPTTMRTTPSNDVMAPLTTTARAPSSPTTDPPVSDPGSEEADPGPLTLAVDPAVAPELASVSGLEAGDPPRPVARMAYADGETADLVLGEVIVATADRAALDDFVRRYEGEVVDSFAGEGDDVVEYLVRVTPPDADPEAAAAALLGLEPGHAGAYRVGDPALLSMLEIAAAETVAGTFELSLNQLSDPMEISDGEVQEAPNQRNAFRWRYLRTDGPLEHGVPAAWQLIEQHGKDDHEVRIAIGDGGFHENPDFPAERTMRFGDWNVPNPKTCTGESSCPWHGTNVALTALGRIDNDYGAAGVAGQVGVLIAAELNFDYWTQMRRLRKVVEEERPHILNLSLGTSFRTFLRANQHSADRHLKAMRDDGALIFTSAGNDNRNVDQEACLGSRCWESRLILPCESLYAVCVGGTDSGSPSKHADSNFGTAGGSRSVELYAPFCVVVPVNPMNQGVREGELGCGSSFSSPFVAGAAALVKAADMSLTGDEVLTILRNNVHVGGVHDEDVIRRSAQQRPDVLGAVAEALGVEQTAPELSITAPTNGIEIGPEDWFELRATAVDFKGQRLEVTWESDLEGVLGTSFDEVTAFEWGVGSHDVRASATDEFGRTTTRHLTIHVVKAPPVMGIGWPADGAAVYETTELALIGSSQDPDTYQQLPDSAVRWVVRRDGVTVFTATGHHAAVPSGVLSPGGYDVTFFGAEATVEGKKTHAITVLEVTGSLPVPVITSQFADTPYGYGGGPGVAFTLEGTASDAEDGPAGGTQFRWLAAADGHQRVLCTGTHFAPAAVPLDGPVMAPNAPAEPAAQAEFGVFTDCSSVDVELGLAPGAIGSTVWSLVLQVTDDDGQVGEVGTKVAVTYAAG